MPDCRNLVRRFIPAYAGNAPQERTQIDQVAVHPRIRGERHVQQQRNVLDAGSSPHTRGTPWTTRSSIFCPRFIPAYAGNAADHSLQVEGRAVHPRIRGERESLDSTVMEDGGSSPHTRGTLRPTPPIPHRRRFIPAYAGNASEKTRIWICEAVHPRIRGERCSRTIAISSVTGSSPHTRGTRDRLGFAVGLWRFIPAYAGNACTGRTFYRPAPVHPRIRGERLASAGLLNQGYGSSPHTRGTRCAVLPN